MSKHFEIKEDVGGFGIYTHKSSHYHCVGHRTTLNEAERLVAHLDILLDGPSAGEAAVLARANGWSAGCVERSTWYWWCADAGKLALPVYVDREGLVFLFTARPDGVHYANIGGLWKKMEGVPREA